MLRYFVLYFTGCRKYMRIFNKLHIYIIASVHNGLFLKALRPALIADIRSLPSLSECICSRLGNIESSSCTVNRDLKEDDCFVVLVCRLLSANFVVKFMLTSFLKVIDMDSRRHLVNASVVRLTEALWRDMRVPRCEPGINEGDDSP